MNTIIIHYTPKLPPIPLPQISTICSDYGPVSKTLPATKTSVAVKYINASDAHTAVKSLHLTQIPVKDKSYTLHVSLQSKINKKKKNRVILRNLSFYANEKDVTKHLAKTYGPVVEVNLPKVPFDDVKKKKGGGHVGFAFVTFETSVAARQAVEKGVVVIKGRQCAVDWSVSKFEDRKRKREEEEGDGENDDGDDDDDVGEGDNIVDSEDDDEDEDDKTEDNDESKDKEETKDEKHEETKKEHRDLSTAIFLRNLPFDVRRHDLFQLFKSFGIVECIYIVKDKITNQPKGTAFVYFQRKESQQLAVTAGNDTEGDGLLLSGRRLFVDEAMTKDTAETMSSKERIRADRRHMYLKDINHLKSNEGVPQKDLDKRVRAKREVITKMKSPLFFINDRRLSVMNLNKNNVDKEVFRQLIIDATMRGLDDQRVSVEDIKANLASNGIDWRELKDEGVQLPEFDEKNSNQLVPSVHITLDDNGRSRGFGFAEFEHHVHALACLRELDNNPRYAKDYVIGGRARSEDFKVPRLICEFTVENKIKAKEQAERRQSKQRRDKKLDNKKDKSGLKKMSRGQRQREQKRLAKQNKQEMQGGGAGTSSPSKNAIIKPQQQRVDDDGEKKTKVKKMKKKMKIDKEEVTFDEMVRSYKNAFAANSGKNMDNSAGLPNKTLEKRWFEE